MILVNVHTIDTLSTGIQLSKKFKNTTDMRYPIHIPRLLSHRAFCLITDAVVPPSMFVEGCGYKTYCNDYD